VTTQLRRAAVSVLVAVVAAGLAACGGMAMTSTTVPRGTAAARPAASQLSSGAIYGRIAPSVVDVTSWLRYDGETAEGTGFVINAREALVLTNNHVIRDATEVTVTLTSSGRRYPARIVGTDVPADIALLQLRGPGAGLVTAPVGHSGAIAPGARVVAIGNKAGAGGAPAAAPGIISGTGQTIEANDSGSGFTETLYNMLRTSARIAPGDSGGPLASAAGQVIGVDTAAGSGTGDRSGYAIPIDYALAAARLIVTGRPAPGVTTGTHGFLGVVIARHGQHSSRAPSGGSAGTARGTPSCVQTSAAAAAPRPGSRTTAPAPRRGALVTGVLCGTGAAAAGLAAGDVITGANGQRVPSAGALTAIMSTCRPGTAVTVTWISAAGQQRTRQVRLDVAPAVLPPRGPAERPAPSRQKAGLRRGYARMGSRRSGNTQVDSA
jgi:S1-C subfamily serine protease